MAHNSRKVARPSRPTARVKTVLSGALLIQRIISEAPFFVSCHQETFPWNRASFPRLGKCSPGTEQAFPARENVPLKPSKLFPLGKTFPWNRASFSRLGKRSPGTGQAFPAWENVPHERGKVFPPGKMFPTSQASFSRLGKRSPRARQAFPAWENVPHKNNALAVVRGYHLRQGHLSDDEVVRTLSLRRIVWWHATSGAVS